MFFQHQHGRQDGHHRDDVNVDAGFYGAQARDGEAPGGEAQGGGPQTQKQDVERIDRPRKTPQIPTEIQEKQGREHEQEAVKEYAPRRLHRVIAKSAYFSGQNRIDGPHRGGQEGQKIPQGIEAQNLAAVEADEGQARYGGGKADEEAGRQPLPVQKNRGQDGGEITPTLEAVE